MSMKKLGIYFAFVLFASVSGWKKEMENPNLFGGDMILSPDQKAALHGDKTAYGSRTGHRWPNAVVPYVIHRSLGQRARSAIQEAIKDYHKYTCLKWRPHNGERGYVSFWRGGGCSSWVGYSGGKMDISIGSGCEDKGTAIHEMGHAIGLYHEQNRPDRDNYIRINKNNVQSGMYYNFQKESDVNSLGTPYDLRSIMHYSSTSFAINYRYKTITTVDPSKQSLIDHGDRIFNFSPIDIQQINLMYNCGNVKPPPSTPAPPPGACVNKENECEFWARVGYCVDAKEKQYMADNCCKACKEFGCANNNTQCDYWAGRGECNKNPTWMKKHCRKACNQC